MIIRCRRCCDLIDLARIKYGLIPHRGFNEFSIIQSNWSAKVCDAVCRSRKKREFPPSRSLLWDHWRGNSGTEPIFLRGLNAS